MRLKIGSRKSDLARLQAKHIGHLLRKAHPHLEIEYDFRESLGDKNLSDPLWKAPEKGVFTSDLAEALENQSVDLVVHSWKDMPIETSPLRQVVGTSLRADPRDLLLIKKTSLDRVSQLRSLKIFSSSPRREYCLTRFLPELWPHSLEEITVTSVRGNIPTRMRKLMEAPEIDALVVAKAAVDRLIGSKDSEFKEVGNLLSSYIKDCVWMILPLSTFPTAPAQGALALEILQSRKDLKTLLTPIIDVSGTLQAEQERAVLKSYGGGCHQKIGCTILDSKSGHAVKSLTGLTDQGEKLKSLGLLVSKKSPSPVWSSKEWDSWKVRTEFQGDLEPLNKAQIILVSKAEALPKLFHARQEQVLWVAGLQTWKKLAKQGHWVNGCSDGLGLTSPDLTFLGAEHKSSVVVTHQRMPLPPNAMATYEVHWKSSPAKPNLTPGQPIYLRSRMDFEMAREIGLFNEPRIVYCGLGETFSFLQQFRSLFLELRAVHSEEDL